jgi:hypothetical protein
MWCRGIPKNKIKKQMKKMKLGLCFFCHLGHGDFDKAKGCWIWGSRHIGGELQDIRGLTATEVSDLRQ